MHLIGSTILAWLNLVGWLAVSVVLLGNAPAIFGTPVVGCCVLAVVAGWLFVCSVVTFRFTDRCLLLLKRRPPVEAEAKLPDETAPQPSPPPPNARRPIFEPLSRGFSETMARLGDAIKDAVMDWTPDDADRWEPAEVPLPPMQPKEFTEALHAPVETVLASLAETINAATDARAVLNGRERCQELLGAFLDGALEVALKLRVEAAMAELPALQPSGAPVEWHAAEPELRGPTRSWVEKYRRMQADDNNWL